MPTGPANSVRNGIGIAFALRQKTQAVLNGTQGQFNVEKLGFGQGQAFYPDFAQVLPDVDVVRLRKVGFVLYNLLKLGGLAQQLVDERVIIGKANLVHVVLTERADAGLFEQFADFVEA